jgi:GNAT superfamily N-acetyltransferase
MRPLNLHIEAIDAVRADLAEIADVSRRQFGHGYFETGILERLELYRSTARLVVAHEQSRGTLVGFCLTYMLPEDGLATFLRAGSGDEQGPASILRKRDKAGTIGVIQTICVVESLRGRGLARTLGQEAERELVRYQPSDILVPAWSLASSTPSGKMLDGLGYSKLLTVSKYWGDECDEGRFRCPCRTSECVCDMVLYWKLVQQLGASYAAAS